MKYFFRILFVIVISISLSACSSIQKSKETISPFVTNTSKAPYLSLTLTTLTDGKLINHFYVYDLTTKKVEEVRQIPMTAQYAVGAVDRKNHALYYSERDSTRSDQLMRIDLKTNKKEKLTTDLFSINHIIPVNNKIIMSASLKGQRNIPLATYDLQSKKLTFWDKYDNDICVRSLTLNPFTGKLYASLYSYTEERQKSGKADIEQTSIVIPPVHRVVEYDTEGHLLKEIYKKEEMVTLFAVSKDENLALIRTAPYVFADRKLYLLNLKTGKKDLLKTENYGAIEHTFFSPNSKGFFFTARESSKNQDGTPNALYYYNLQTNQIEKVFAKSGGYINNFLLLN